MYIERLYIFVKRCHGHRQYTSPQLIDVQNVAKSEDNFSDVISLPDSLSMYYTTAYHIS
jgi:hypothetical protein